MIYADTDLFLALLKEDDWLGKKVKEIYGKHKDEIWTSPITAIELLLLSEEYNLDPERLMVNLIQITKVKGIDLNVLLLAAHYMKDKNINVFDALHASYCGKDRIVSSDKIFDKIGIERIKLEER